MRLLKQISIVLAMGASFLAFMVGFVFFMECVMDYKHSNQCKAVAELRGLEVVVIGGDCYTKSDGERVY